MSEHIDGVHPTPEITFEETVAWALYQQEMDLTPDLRKKWIREHFCTQAELGRIAALLNTYSVAVTATNSDSESCLDAF